MKQTKSQMVAAALAVAEELHKGGDKVLKSLKTSEEIMDYASVIAFRNTVYKAYDEMMATMKSYHNKQGVKNESI